MLCLPRPTLLMAQGTLVQVLGVENLSEMPALGCFCPSYAEVRFRNDFGTKEMMFAEVNGVLTVRRNSLFVSVNHYGYANYGEFQASVGYGRCFGDRFAMTARLFYLMSHARDYPTRNSLYVDFALVGKISDKLYLDAGVTNPFMMRYGIVGQEIVPMHFTTSCTYIPIRKLLVSFRMSKMLPGAWEVCCRFLSNPVTPLLVAAECSNSHLGVTVHWIYRKFLFSVQTAWYYRVFVSPQLGVGISRDGWA